jgi:hypothetical protein
LLAAAPSWWIFDTADLDLSPSQNIYSLPLQIPPSKYCNHMLQVSESTRVYDSPSTMTLVIKEPQRRTRIFFENQFL